MLQMQDKINCNPTRDDQNESVKNYDKYGKDIDDNCPMTGDETDTDCNVFHDLDVCLNHHTLKDMHEELIDKNASEFNIAEIGVLASNKDLEETLSSDQHFFSDEESSIAGSYDDLEKSEFDEEDSSFKPVSERSREEASQQEALKQHLDQLGELVLQREYLAQKSRADLQIHNEHLKMLECEKKNVELYIKETPSEQVATLNRLKNKLELLISQIEKEQDTEKKLQQTVKDAEFFLAQTYIEHGKFLPLDENLTLDQQKFGVKIEKVNSRLKKEIAHVVCSDKKRKAREKEHISASRERERKNRQAVMSAKKNREVAIKYLKETMSKVRQKDSEEENKSRKDLDNRVNILLSLKRNIQLSKENDSILLAQNAYRKKKEENMLNFERKKLIEKGENPDEVLTRKNKIRQFEREKETFERKQREREIQIVNKIISEEKQMTRRHQQQQQVLQDNRLRRVPRRRSKPRGVISSGSESVEYSADVEDTGGRMSYLRCKVSTDEDGEFSPFGLSTRDDDNCPREITEDKGIVIDNEDTLAEPDFEGLWNYKSPNDIIKADFTGEEMVKEVVLENFYKGSGFHIKPDILIFKDFDVGKTYNKKVLLTNVSYTKNYCQFVGVSETLIDFIEVNFISSGPMSAGLTCDLTVTFKPMINESLDGFIKMKSSSGIFKIPLKCIVKCCEAYVSDKEIDFNNVVVGEVQKKFITLGNKGALPTEYQFFNVDKDEGSCFTNVKNYNGILQAYASVQLELAFSPKVSGKVESDFKIVLLHETLEPIFIKVRGTAVDFPLWIEREIVNLHVCMFDRLYQDSVLINSRASTTFRLRFEIPKELHDHLDILPKTAFIQPESQLSVQLKFLPRKSILTDAALFLKKDSGVFEIPIVIRIADQVQFIQFLLHTVITSSDIEFNTEEVDFGYCTVYESVSHSVQLINMSILAQDFGFIGVPEIIEIQPNDGFGTILPNEHLDLIILFSPKKAQDYNFELVCKSHIGRKFHLRCKGVGVLPPLILSEQLVKFKPTAVMDTSTTHIFISNQHESINPFTHSVSRIGNGSPFPVGSTMFEFVLPLNSPLEISPSCGRISPGQKCLIHITFAPKLDKHLIEKKSLELLKEEEAILEKQNFVESAQMLDETKNGKNNPKAQKKSLSPKNILRKPLSDQRLFLKNAEYLLQRTFEDSFYVYKVPCFIAPDNCEAHDQKQYNHYTLFLEVHCPSIKPGFLVLSADGDNTVNFGKVLIGKRCVQTVTLENLSENSILLSSSFLDPSGPFELTGSLKEINKHGFGSIKLSFTPKSNEHFYDVLEVFSEISKARIYLKGQGTYPQIRLDPPGPILNFGDVLVMDTLKMPLKITNTAEVSIDFDLTLYSLKTNSNQSVLKNESDVAVGPSNYSGICVFGCSPVCGNLEPGESKEVCLSFSPDHASSIYCDTLAISINGTNKPPIKLCGCAWDYSAYSYGWDILTPTQPFVDSLMLGLQQNIGDTIGKTLLLSFHCSMNDGTIVAPEKVVQLGCIKSILLPPSKKSCEYIFESLQESVEKGITIDFVKGTIEAGTRKNVTFKWQPSNYYEDLPMQCTIQLTMKCEDTLIYKILVRGYVD